MTGKEAIINKILQAAEEQANNIIGDANVYAEEVIAKSLNQAEEFSKNSLGNLDEQQATIVAKRKSVAGLDVKKMMLQARKQAIDNAFVNAISVLNNLDSKTYKSIIAGMIQDYAEDGDAVIFSKKDGKVITKAFINAEAKKKDITLTVSTDKGDFEGGIILSNGGLDKNLTFDVELKMLREDVETEIANLIFNKEK